MNRRIFVKLSLLSAAAVFLGCIPGVKKPDPKLIAEKRSEFVSAYKSLKKWKTQEELRRRALRYAKAEEALIKVLAGN